MKGRGWKSALELMSWTRLSSSTARGQGKCETNLLGRNQESLPAGWDVFRVL